MNHKKLVITSDDFGMSCGVNLGIDTAAKSRLITCTNYMVPTPWFAQAIHFAKSLKIDLGIHLTLTNEWDFYKWKPITHAKTLIDKDGYLYKNIVDLMEHASVEDILQECRAQIEIAKKKDTRISFVDLHMCIPTFENNVLVNPKYELKLLDIVKRLAEEADLIYPYELRNEQLLYFDSFISISGKADNEIANYLQKLPPGNHHLSCHCSVNSQEQAHYSSADSPANLWALDYRVRDSEIIGSSWFRKIIKDTEIEIISLSDLTSQHSYTDTYKKQQNINKYKL